MASCLCWKATGTRRVRWVGGRRTTHMPRYVILVNWTDQGIKNVKQTARAHRPRRRDRREARVEAGAGLLDGRSLRHGHRLRGTGRRSPERPPPGDRLFGQRANHHAKGLRRRRDVGDTPEARLNGSISENSILRGTPVTSSTRQNKIVTASSKRTSCGVSSGGPSDAPLVGELGWPSFYLTNHADFRLV